MTGVRAEGVLIVFTGNGKGKTTAALGCALRTASYGRKALVVQFMKAPGSSGEQALCPAGLPAIEVMAGGTGFLFPGDDPGPHRQAAGEAWARMEEKVRAGDYSLLVLDELNVAMRLNLIAEEAVLAFLEERPPGLNIIITGRDAPARLVEAAQVVTEMREIKHAYREGLPAVEGIDY